MITSDEMGGRRIKLYLPFQDGDNKVEDVFFRPWTFGDTMDWRDGKYKTILALMIAISDKDESVIRKLRRPDDDRVFAEFMSMVPPEIVEDAGNRQVPVPVEDEVVAAAPPEERHDEPEKHDDNNGLGMDLER